MKAENGHRESKIGLYENSAKFYKLIPAGCFLEFVEFVGYFL